jgi:c-di-GMP-binding flagellar brake protein YcgR
MDEMVIPIEAELTLFRSQLAALQRRKDRRYRCGLATSGKLFCSGTTEARIAWVFNLSRGGIGLEISEALPKGQELVVHLKTTDKDTTIKASAQVMHSTPTANGSWRIGCRFSERLSVDVLESLL